MFSYIQIQILTKLLASNGLRYSEACPSGVDDDLFNYHLQFLVKKGYVEKENGLYKLSNLGKINVQPIDALGNWKEFFKFSVLPYVVRTNLRKKEILLQRRLRHPYFGNVETVSGKVVIGEKVEDAAKRKLEEETGLTCDFRLLGVIRKIRRSKDGKIIEDTLYHACYGENPEGILEEKNVFGDNLWAEFNEARKLQKQNVTASDQSEEILNRVETGNLELFYFNEDLTVNTY